MKKLFILLLCLPFALYGQIIPKLEQQIPLYPGAVIDKQLQEQAKQAYIDSGDENIYAASVNVYVAKALPDDVCRFYIKKLGAQEDFSNTYPAKPWYEPAYFPKSDFEDQYHRDLKIHDGKWFKSALSQRSQWKNGEWLESAYFEWEVLQSNGDLARFRIAVEDDSFDNATKTASTKTIITFLKHVEKSAGTMNNESDETMQENAEEALDYFKANPPTAASLGVAFYPGWKFLTEQSAEMSANAECLYYVFTTPDAPQKVLGYYELKLNRKAGGNGETGFIIPLKGNLPIPDEGLTIQKNTMFGDNAQTVITIQKQF